MAKLYIERKLYIGRGPDKGGHFLLYKNGKEIGDAHVAYEHKGTEYALSGYKPAKTAVIDSLELDEGERGKGYGGWFINAIEKDAINYGMERVFLTSVMGDAESFWEKVGYRYSGHNRVWKKEIKGINIKRGTIGRTDIGEGNSLRITRKTPRITPERPKLRR